MPRSTRGLRVLAPALLLAPFALVPFATPAAAATSLEGGFVFERRTGTQESNYSDLVGLTASGQEVALTDVGSDPDRTGHFRYGFRTPVPAPGGRLIAATFVADAFSTAVVYNVAADEAVDLYAACERADDFGASGAEWLADGRVLVSGVDNAAGRAAVTHVVTADGAECEQLTGVNRLVDERVTVSADGTLATWVKQQSDGMGGFDEHLVVGNPDGTAARSIGQADQRVYKPVISPDGKKVVMEKATPNGPRAASLTVPPNDYQYFIEPMSEITDIAGSPAWSADSSTIVYSKLNNQLLSQGLYAYRFNQVRQLTAGADYSPRAVLAGEPVVATPRDIDLACPEGEVPAHSFTDITGDSHERAIACLVWWKVANGTTATTYNPGGTVSRSAMAAFVARMIEKVSPELLQSSPADAFSDDNGNPHELRINQLAALGVVGGTGPGTYNPSGTVSRGQMAKFLAKAAETVLGEPLPIEADYFADDDNVVFNDDINRIAGAGLTGGRPDGTYNASGQVLRNQMGSFLARSLDLFVENGASTPTG